MGISNNIDRHLKPGVQNVASARCDGEATALEDLCSNQL